jgi:hypothetical protein
MAKMQPRYCKEEFAHLGREIYERDVQPRLQPGDDGKFVAVDIETAAYETDWDDYIATQRLLDQVPNAQIWLARAGHRAAYTIGGR